MAVAVWLIDGIHKRDAITRAAEKRLMSDPHVAAYADVAPERAEQRSADQQVAGEECDESGIIRQRNEHQIGVKAINHWLVCEDEERKREGRRDHAGHDAFDHKRSAHEPFGGTDKLHHLDLLATVIDSGSNRVHHDHDRDDYENRHQADASKAEPGGQLEHSIDEVA